MKKHLVFISILRFELAAFLVEGILKLPNIIKLNLCIDDKQSIN